MTCKDHHSAIESSYASLQIRVLPVTHPSPTLHTSVLPVTHPSPTLVTPDPFVGSVFQLFMFGVLHVRDRLVEPLSPWSGPLYVTG